MGSLLLEIEGMKCGGCVRAVEQKLLEQPGVASASVNLLSRSAWVELQGEQADRQVESVDAVSALVQALAGLGFAAQLREQGDDPLSRRQRLQERSWWQQWRQLVVALALVLVSSLGHLAMLGLLGGSGVAQLLGHPWLHAVVATIALAGPGRAILINGGRGLLHAVPGMDSLVGVGLASAYGASVVGLLWPASGWPCFFNEPVMLLGFVLSGRFLEERARYRTGWALEQLAQLQPDTAQLLVAPGQTRPLRVGGLRPGDVIVLSPGDRVPVDGVVRQGAGAVDVSALTGEPMPLTAAQGVELAAGSLNLEAVLELEVLRSGADSAVARIMALVERAQARKAPIQGLADRVAGRFSVAVLALAAVTFVFWWQWGARHWPWVLQASGHGMHGVHGVLGHHAETPLALALQLAIAVLVVACPCALGLATPTAITVGAGLAARRGLLFRGGDAIEMASRLKTVLFDKTGTLTVGRPLVQAVEPVADCSADALIALAAGVEAGSRHPLAFALLQEAGRRGLNPVPVSAASAVAGEGVQATVASAELARVGRLGWLQQQGIAVPEQLAQTNASQLGVASGPRFLGTVHVADQPRPDAKAALAELRRLGLRLALLSGDARGSVQQLGGQLGLEPSELAWELRPEHKLDQLERHKAAGITAMVGDGINDAPALAAADLAIAIGTGTQVAQDTADLVILGDRIGAVPEAIHLARATMAKVRQNLAWAFGYNLIVIPIAAGVLLPGFGVLLTPPLAALLMALSSITVVLNALLLQDGGRNDALARAR
ncbi:MAG: heavy metal translocating P-type ATPase [Prochlorococcaceae cyanobacterium]